MVAQTKYSESALLTEKIAKGIKHTKNRIMSIVGVYNGKIKP